MNKGKPSDDQVDRIKACLVSSRAFLDETIQMARKMEMQNTLSSQFVVQTWATLEQFAPPGPERKLAGPMALVITHLVKETMESDNTILAEVKSTSPERYSEFFQHMSMVNSLAQSALVRARDWTEDQLAVSFIIGTEVVCKLLNEKSYAAGFMNRLFAVGIARYITQTLNRSK